jgi:dTDP-4-dehydrorhamnose 3,5-epimerase
MKIIDTVIKDVKIIEPTVYEDERGFFFESFNQKKFEENVGLSVEFVQDNHSRSRKGVLRGMHYQLPPKEQAKLVRVTHGIIYDIAVDIRKSSKTFGKWVGVKLSEKNKKQLWIPAGFAHGFLTLSTFAEVNYKATDYYDPNYESGFNFHSATLNINWPSVGEIVTSEKDRNLINFDTDTFPGSS